MNLNHLRVFYVVARRLSYSRAAEDLYISQPAVSRHVHALEKELGACLFNQTGNRIHLTDAGRIVYDFAQRVFALTEEAYRALAALEGLERGNLRLGASSTPGIYLLPEVLARFRERYPGVAISLDITNSQRVVEDVTCSQLDLGFVGSLALPPELHMQPFLADELVLVVSPTHPFAHHPPSDPEDWQGETYILREPGSATRQFMQEGLQRLSVRVERLLELRGSEAIKRAVAAGLGVSFLSVHAVTAEVKRGDLCVVDRPDLRFARRLHIVSHKDVRPTAAILAFLAFVRKYLPPGLPL